MNQRLTDGWTVLTLWKFIIPVPCVLEKTQKRYILTEWTYRFKTTLNI